MRIFGAKPIILLSINRSDAKLCPPAPEEGGPFLNLLVVLGEYVRGNMLTFSISSGGMVGGP